MAESASRNRYASGLALCVLLFARVTKAEDPSSTAEAAFERGLQEMEAGRFGTGCPLLAESYRLEPLPGALFTLAECERKWGKVASAAAHYQDYLTVFSSMTSDQKTTQVGRDKVAAEALGVVQKEVPRLRLDLSRSATGAVVDLDGARLGTPSLGVWLPLDPGVHVIRVRSEDGRTATRRVELVTRDRKRLALSLPAQKPDSGPRKPTRGSSVERPSAGPWAPIAFGVGGAGLILGTVAGILMLREKPTVEDNCEDNVCTREGKQAADRAQRAGLFSTIGFGVAIVGGAAGVVLTATAPEKAPERQARKLGWTVSTAW